jgi:hypothetical protein
VIASLSINLIHQPDQAQAITFKVGYTGATVFDGGVVVRGQSFRLDSLGSFSTAGSDSILNSVQFLFSSAAPAGGTTLYIYGSIPTITALSTGSGALMTSTGFTSVAGNANADFSGATDTNRNVTFNFNSPSVILNASTTYYALFSSGQSIRGQGSNPYTGGNSIICSSCSTLTEQTTDDRAFIVIAETIPFEFEAMGGVMILGVGIALHRWRKLKK